MVDFTTVARPYADALFNLAHEQKTLDTWLEALIWLSTIIQNPDLAARVSSPTLTHQEIEHYFVELLGPRATESVKRFIALLIANHRLATLPAIAQQFQALKDQAEKTLDTVVQSAFPLTDKQTADLSTLLAKRYKKAVRLKVRLVPELIGGVKIIIGDQVIDASVRGKLNALANSLQSA